MSDNPSRPITIVLLVILAVCLIAADHQTFGVLRGVLASHAINGASQ